MKLGSDFVWVARLILLIIKAILQFAEATNGDSAGTGKEIE